MTGIAPGWYKDPADPSTQRYWDGEGWIGHALPADAPTPPGPPPEGGPLSPPSAPTSPGNGQSPDAASGPAPGGVPPTEGSGPPAVAGSPAAGGWSEAAGPAGSQPSGPGQPPAGGQPPGPGQPPAGGQPPDWPAGEPAGLPYHAYRYSGRIPAPRPHGLALATPGARLVARLIDIGVLALLNLLVNGWFIWQYAIEIAPTIDAWQRYFTRQDTDAPENTPRSGYLQIVIILIAAALWLAYEVPSVANTGQTLGKRVLGIRVVRLEAPGPVGFARALRRWNTLGLPTLLWSCCGIGFVLQFVDVVFLLIDRPLQQALHDKSARTVVVRVGAATPTDQPDEPRESGQLNHPATPDRPSKDEPDRPSTDEQRDDPGGPA